MGNITLLPLPINILEGVIPRHTTRPAPLDMPKKPTIPQKTAQRMPHQGESSRMSTKSEPTKKKVVPKIPLALSSSSSNEEANRFQEDLTKAMKISMSADEEKNGDKT